MNLPSTGVVTGSPILRVEDPGKRRAWLAPISMARPLLCG